MSKRTIRNIPLHISSAQIIPIGFLLLISIGTFLLSLPIASQNHSPTPFLTALFTSTTSVCVTGLTIVDTYSHWSLFGHIIILILVQVGGLGVIAVSSSFLLMIRKKLSIRDRVLIRDAFNLDSISGLIPFLRRVFQGVFLVEGIGMVLYLFSFVPRYGWLKGLWFSIFHSVSAFCNAGLDLIGPNSIQPFQNDLWMLSVTMALIVVGGLGFIVWFDLFTGIKNLRNGKRSHYSEHTKLVLILTGFLVVFGAVSFYFFERGNDATIGKMPLGMQLFHSLFQSVTCRTAGFSGIPQESLHDSSILASCILMFIGGSPMGTAGGVKTVTLFLLFANAFCYVGSKKNTAVMHRTIPTSLIQKATAIIYYSLTISLIMSCVLISVENISVTDGIFEVFSATGTVGLSRALTPQLSSFGKWIIIICMYLGRLGPISLALFFHIDDPESKDTQYANGHFYVG